MKIDLTMTTSESGEEFRKAVAQAKLEALSSERSRVAKRLAADEARLVILRADIKVKHREEPESHALRSMRGEGSDLGDRIAADHELLLEIDRSAEPVGQELMALQHEDDAAAYNQLVQVQRTRTRRLLEAVKNCLQILHEEIGAREVLASTQNAMRVRQFQAGHLNTLPEQLGGYVMAISNAVLARQLRPDDLLANDWMLRTIGRDGTLAPLAASEVAELFSKGIRT